MIPKLHRYENIINRLYPISFLTVPKKNASLDWMLSLYLSVRIHISALYITVVYRLIVQTVMLLIAGGHMFVQLSRT